MLSTFSSATSSPPPPPPEGQAWPHEEMGEDDDPGMLRAHLFDLGLEEYVQRLADRGISTPRHLEALTTAQIEALLPEKPVHARRLAAHGSLRRGIVGESSRDMGSLSPAQVEGKLFTAPQGTVSRGRLRARKKSLQDAKQATTAEVLPPAGSGDQIFVGPWNNELIIDSLDSCPSAKFDDSRALKEVGTEKFYERGVNSADILHKDAALDVESKLLDVPVEVSEGSASAALHIAEVGISRGGCGNGGVNVAMPENTDSIVNMPFSPESHKVDERIADLFTRRNAAAKKYKDFPSAARQEAQIAATLSSVAALSATLHAAEVRAEAADNHQRSRLQADTTRTFVPWISTAQCVILLKAMPGSVCMGERAAVAVALCACLEPEEAEDIAEAFFERHRSTTSYANDNRSNSGSINGDRGRSRNREQELDAGKVDAPFSASPTPQKGRVDVPNNITAYDFWCALDCSQLPALEEAVAELMSVHGSKAAAERNWRQLAQSYAETDLQLRFLGANFHSRPMPGRSASLNTVKASIKTAPHQLIRQTSMLSMRGASIRYKAEPTSFDGGSMDPGKLSSKRMESLRARHALKTSESTDKGAHVLGKAKNAKAYGNDDERRARALRSATFKLAAEFVLSAAASSAVLLENARVAAERALAARRRVPTGILPPDSGGVKSSNADDSYRVGWIGSTSFDPHSSISERLSLAALLLAAMRASVLAETREVHRKAFISKERITNESHPTATLNGSEDELSTSIDDTSPFSLVQLHENAEPGDDRVDERGPNGKLPQELDAGGAAAKARRGEHSSDVFLSAFELHTHGEGLPALAARTSGEALMYAQKATESAFAAVDRAHSIVVASRRDWTKKLPGLGKHALFQSEVRKAFSNPFSLDPAISNALKGSTELELKHEALRAASTENTSNQRADSVLKRQQRDDTIVDQLQTYHKLVTSDQITPSQALTLAAKSHGDFKKTAAKTNLRARREPINMPIQSRVTKEVDSSAKRRVALETAEQLFCTLRAAPRLQFAAVPGSQDSLLLRGAVDDNTNELGASTTTSVHDINMQGNSVVGLLADGREMWEVRAEAVLQQPKLGQAVKTEVASEDSCSRIGLLRRSNSSTISSSIDTSAPPNRLPERQCLSLLPGALAKVHAKDDVPTSTMERFLGISTDERFNEADQGDSGMNSSNYSPITLHKQPPQRRFSKIVQGAFAVMESIRQMTSLSTQDNSTAVMVVFRVPKDVHLGRSVLRLKLPKRISNGYDIDDDDSDDDDNGDDDSEAGQILLARPEAKLSSAEVFGMQNKNQGPVASLQHGDATSIVNSGANFDSSNGIDSKSIVSSGVNSNINRNDSRGGIDRSATSSGTEKSSNQSDSISNNEDVAVVASAEEVPLEGARNALAAHAACRHTTARALFRLGAVYRNGTGMPFDANKAVECWRMAAELGHSEAQNNLGVMYASGDGAAHNDQLAVKMYSLAAGQGVVSAQFNLACMLAEGRGAPSKDEKTAVALWSAAAANNHLGAHFNLGVMFEKGRGGLNKDLLRAIAHYTYAAERGHSHSSFNLGFLYEKGGDLGAGKVPFPPFPALAEYYYALAAQAGDEEADQRLESLRDRRFKATKKERRANERACALKKSP